MLEPGTSLYLLSTNLQNLDKIISKYGTIIKREPLTGISLSDDQGFLLIKTKDPFPGFYCSDKDLTDISCKEMAWYIPLQGIKPEEQDDIIRICKQAEVELNIDACPGTIQLKGKQTCVIRFKGDNSGIKKLAALLNITGFKTYKNQKISTYLGEINLKLNFELLKIKEGIYQNTQNENLYYMTTKYHNNWKSFEKLITFQKSQMQNRNFDAATGYWIESSETVDFLRVFSKKPDKKELRKIIETYNSNAKSYLKDKSIF